MTSEPNILILKYLQGNLTSTEKDELFMWVNASEANKKEFEAYAEAWKLTAKAPENEFSLDEGWDDLALKLRGYQPAPAMEKSIGKQVHLKQRWLVGIAASISLFVILYFAVFALTRTETEVIATHQGEVKEVTLPDGSTVWLNGDSKVAFIKRFNETTREVELEGEAFFEIARDEQRPFIVHTGKVNTRVLGTSFNLKSTAEQNQVEIVVFSGKVEFYSQENRDNKALLTTGMKGVYLTEKDTIVSEENTNPNVISWQNNTLIFKDTPVEEVLELLNSRFNVEISASEKSIYSCKFTSTFKQASLKEILNVLALSLGLNYTQEGNKYTLKGSGCF